METLLLFIKALGIGIAIAAPVGPVGVLCLRRTLEYGHKTGVASGLGAATADGIYAAVAALGLGWVSNLALAHQDWLALVGGFFICYLGLRSLRSRPSLTAENRPVGGVSGAYVSTLLITLTNPLTILAIATIFAGLGLVKVSNGAFSHGAILVTGVFIGSASWWLALAVIGGLVRRGLQEKHLLWINRCSGALLMIMGLGLISRALWLII